MTTHVTPHSTSIAGEISPVNAPSSAQHTFCAPNPIAELAERVARRGQRGERRADHRVDVGQRQVARAHVGDERARLRDRLVHLPVPDDQRPSRAHDV